MEKFGTVERVITGTEDIEQTIKRAMEGIGDILRNLGDIEEFEESLVKGPASMKSPLERLKLLEMSKEAIAHLIRARATLRKIIT